MSEVVTSRLLLDEIRSSRDAMQSASEWAKTTAVDKPRAEIAFENAYAHAFIEAKQDKATDSLAKQLALIATSVERQKMLELREESMVARAELHAWSELFAAYRTIGFVSQQEMKLADG